MREIPAIKQSVRIKPDQATFFPNNEKLFALSWSSNKIPAQTGNRGKMQGEKKDKIPAKKTEIENNIVSNKEPTFLIILILFYYNQFYLYDFCYANWTMQSFNYLLYL